MFGLGIQELLLLGVFAAAVAVIVFIIVRASGGSSAGSVGGSDRIASLEDENRRLRAELDDLRGKRDRPT